MLLTLHVDILCFDVVTRDALGNFLQALCDRTPQNNC